MARSRRNIAWIERYCMVPEGALVGQPVKLRPWQKRTMRGIYDSPTRRAVISFGRKNGKGLALDTPIPTPRGWRTMAQLRVGDEVFGSDGKPTQVEFVSPVHIGLRCWRLTFSDGSSVVADEQHRWLTRHGFRPWANGRISRSGNGGRRRADVVTTPQIADSVMRVRADGGIEYNHHIDCAPATSTPDVEGLPVDPYVLGAWLGDGTSSCAAFTCGEQDIEHMAGALSDALGGSVGIARSPGRAATIRTPGLGLQSALRRMGVLGNKRIPSEYLDAGTDQRWALLQGLMDTDGTVNRNGGKYPRPSFTGTNERLCRGVWRLARSLGLKATVKVREAKLNGKLIGKAWVVAFPADRSMPVFRMERKQRLLSDSLNKRSRSVAIVACDPVESVPTVCIQVSAQDSLFLAGHGCIPTHNTSLSAMLLLLHLVGPEARSNSQLYSAAQSRDQAAILFALAAKMVRMNPALSEFVVVRDTAKQLFCPEIGTLYRALSADASTAYGLSPVFVVHDELGQVRGPRSELYEALETASGAQSDPLSIIISTQAPDGGDLLSMLIDDAATGADPRVKLFMHTAPDDADPWSVKAIRAANPAYGDFLNAAEVQATAATARRMPSAESSYRNLILNQRVQAHSPFVSRSVWDRCAGAVDHDALVQSRCYIGLDLSARHDLTALVLVGHDGERWQMRSEFFCPADGLHDRARRDRAPYDVWVQQGYLTATPGGSVDYGYVARRLIELTEHYDVQEIAFDRWRIDVLKAELSRLGADDLPLVPFGQGFKDMSPALDTLEAELIEGRLNHGDHPIMRWCAANSVVISDPAGNRKLDKAKSSGRIDGMVALVMAMGRAAQHLAPAEIEYDPGAMFA